MVGRRWLLPCPLPPATAPLSLRCGPWRPWIQAHEMRALTVLIATICVSWIIDRFEFEGRYGSSIWRAAQNKAEMLNYEVKRLFKAVS